MLILVVMFGAARPFMSWCKMRVAVDGTKLVSDWRTGMVASGAKPFRTPALSPSPRVVWNGNPFCEPGCVLYLPGLPGTGASIFDFSGQSNTGTIYGATWTRLPSGLWVLDFDGLDDYVNCGAETSLAITGSLTLKCWVKLDVVIASQPDAYPSFIVKQVNSHTNRNYGIHIDKSGNIIGFMGRNVAGNAWIFLVTATASTYCNDLRWHLVHGVWDRGNTTAYIYVDNVEVVKATGQTNGDLYTAGDNRVSIGRMTAFADSFLDGLIALPRIYNRALSALEIMRHFNQERHLFGV